MADRAPDTAATEKAAYRKISYQVPVNVRNGVPICPHCGDEMVEVDRTEAGGVYECRTGRAVFAALWDDLAAAFDGAIEQAGTSTSGQFSERD